MDVVVVESPAKAKTLRKHLGGGYGVFATRGHVSDLAAKDGSVDPAQDFAMTYVANPRAVPALRAVAAALRDADSLVLATDPDREGEAIAWQVLAWLRERGALGDRPVRRVVFHEVTAEAVRAAMANPREIDMDLVRAQQARRALDYLVGFNLSAVLWRKLPGGRSAGRVQSVALRLICEREAEIEAFVPQEYWTVDASVMAERGSFTARLVPFDELDIAVIDVPTLRLDQRTDRQRLQETVERIAPRLLILDPLVRLHSVDENAAGEVAPILGFLRELQRRFETAVLLVHHARKSGGTRPGHALRGSSEPHAWGDSNLYLRRRDKKIVMTVEHRDARDLNDVELELADDGHGPALRIRQEPGPEDPRGEPPADAGQRILQVIENAECPLSQRQIRERAATRLATVAEALHNLIREGRVERAPEGGYRIAAAGTKGEAAPAAAVNGKGRQEALPKTVTGSNP